MFRDTSAQTVVSNIKVNVEKLNYKKRFGMNMSLENRQQPNLDLNMAEAGSGFLNSWLKLMESIKKQLTALLSQS